MRLKIYFTNKLMQNTQQSQGVDSSSEQIINLAINVFQNVGIKRWIDQIQILKNEQIYIDICKIIFPQTIIQLIRISQNPDLNTSEKIQGVINLIAKQIKNDLYHISGDAIARGKLGHLKNFLELLEALSNPMIRKGRIEVQSAPQNDQSINTEDNHPYYTVIGIDKEFQKLIYSEEDESDRQRPVRTHQQPRRRQPQIQKQYQEHDLDASSEQSSEKDFPIKPTNPPNHYQPHPTRKQNTQKVNKQKPQQNSSHKNLKNSRNKKQRASQSSFKKKQIHHAYPTRNYQKYQLESNIENGRWLNLVKRINLAKEELERERLNKIQAEFVQEKREMQQHHKNQLRLIQKEMRERKRFIDEKIGSRDDILKAFKGERQAKEAIKDIFKQEKQVKREQSKKSRQRELDEINNIMNFNEISELFKKAKSSSFSRQSLELHTNDYLDD